MALAFSSPGQGAFTVDHPPPHQPLPQMLIHNGLSANYWKDKQAMLYGKCPPFFTCVIAKEYVAVFIELYKKNRCSFMCWMGFSY